MDRSQKGFALRFLAGLSLVGAALVGGAFQSASAAPCFPGQICDEDAPFIESMSVKPNRVGLSEGAAEVTVRAHVADETGVAGVQVFLSSEQSEQVVWGDDSDFHGDM